MKKSVYPVAAMREIMTTKEWYMFPQALHASRDLFMQALSAHQALSEAAEVKGWFYHTDGTPLNYEEAYEDENFDPRKCINVINVSGDILRNSGMCAMGSMDLKDIMRRYTDMGVLGHVIIINSGGGSAQATYDFEDMVSYAHAAGQPVIAYVRGLACSAAYFLAMLCDKIVTFSDHDIVGSIGSMVALFTQEPGTTNQYTLETYRECYAKKSPMKNYAYREAEMGNMEPFQELADKSCEAFHEAVMKYRPCVGEERMTGEIWDACEVVGTLVDETGVPFQRAIDLCIDERETRRIAALRAGTVVKK